MLNSQIVQKTKILEKKQDEIKSFNFENVDIDIINNNLIEINEKLQSLNQERFYLLKRINNAKNSLEINLNYNIEDNIYKFYQEIQLVFNVKVKKSFDELIKFNEQLLKERKTIAKEQLEKFLKILSIKENEISEVNKQKREKLGVLNEANIQEKYFLANRELDIYKHEIFELEKEKEKFDKILTIVEQEEEEQKENKSSLTYYNTNKDKNNLVNIFVNEFNIEIRNAIAEEICIIYHDNKPVIDIVDNSKKSIKEGSTFTKIISIYFDLILIHSHFINKQKIISPVIHDNVFTDMQDELKIKTIDLMKKYSADKSIQYILTDFKDSFPTDIFIMIEKKEINLVNEFYRTESDYNETLFKKNLKVVK